MQTSAERLHDSVLKHGIMWGELTERVARDNSLDERTAADLVAPLIERRTCYMAVAIALIDLIVEKRSADIAARQRPN